MLHVKLKGILFVLQQRLKSYVIVNRISCAFKIF